MQICTKPELRMIVDGGREAQVASTAISTSEVLRMMPRGLRFLFLDEILEVDRTHISAQYRFRENEYFYEGHFPDRSVTPGSVLLEAMCQCGVTAHSYYLMGLEMGIEKSSRHRVLFTKCEAEWFELVAPGSLVTMHSELLGWKRKHIRARVEMFSETKTLIAQSVLAGTSVSWHPENAAKNSLNPASEEVVPGNTHTPEGNSDES
jgi:3-hydroxyacyl-[acyl-carrier-protein] dehydratase